jgi:6-phosphofructokinase 1
MLVEIMGRYAGWLTLSAGIAGGADIILIPEIEYDLDAICAKVRENGAITAAISASLRYRRRQAKGGQLSGAAWWPTARTPSVIGGIAFKLGDEN